MKMRLSAMQLAALALCARCYSMMTYFPHENNNAAVYIISVLLSSAVQALIILPAVVLAGRTGQGAIYAAGSEKPTVSKIAAALYLLFFMWDIFMTSAGFGYFLDEYFSHRVSGIAALICIAAAAAYLSGLRSSVLGKCAGITLAVFASFTLLLVLSALDRTDASAFHFAVDDIGGTLAQDVKLDILRSREVVMLAFLLGDVKGSHAKSAYSYIGVKAFIVSFVAAFAVLVMGDFAFSTQTPFYYLSCCCTSTIIERFDAGYMSVWTALAVLRLGLGLHCASRCCAVLVSPKEKKTARRLIPFLPAAAAFVVLLFHKGKSVVYLRESLWVIILLAGIIPLGMMLFSKQRSAENESQQI